MWNIEVTAAVLGVCLFDCQLCVTALQLQSPPVPAFPRRGPATARHYRDGGCRFSADPTDVEIGSSDAGVFTERHIHVIGGPNRAQRTAGASCDATAPPASARRTEQVVPRSARSSSQPLRRSQRTKRAAGASRADLLTYDEEKIIAGEIQAFRSVTKAREDLSDRMSREAKGTGAKRQGGPSEDQWAAACSLSVEHLRDVLARGQDARTRLITGNVGLVTVIAQRYHHMVQGGVATTAGGAGATAKLDDLVQEGYLGIMEAAERFDPARGCRFSTYATHWIRQRIGRAVAESSRMIRLPAHVQTAVRHMHRKDAELAARTGRRPSLPELAREVGVPLDTARRYRHATRHVLSLELPVDGRAAAADGRTLGERVARTVTTAPEDAAADALRGQVRALLGALGPAERRVLTRRYGLADGRPQTLRETAAGLGVSVDRVRTAEARAMNRLRHPRLREYAGGPGEACGEYA